MLNEYCDKLEILRLHLLALKKYKGFKKNLSRYLKSYYKEKNFVKSDFDNFILLILSLDGSVDIAYSFDSKFKDDALEFVSLLGDVDLYYKKIDDFLSRNFNSEAKQDESYQLNISEAPSHSVPDVSLDNNFMLRYASEILENLSSSNSDYSKDSNYFVDLSSDIDFSNNGFGQAKKQNYKIFDKSNDQIAKAKSLIDKNAFNSLWQRLNEELQKKDKINLKLLKKLEKQLVNYFIFNNNLAGKFLDNKKFPQLIADYNYQDIYKNEIQINDADYQVSFLLDNSGSMQGEPILTTIVVTYYLCLLLESLKVKTEILGFTTKAGKVVIHLKNGNQQK